MRSLEQIGIHALKEHILKNWMTHDAMWFLHCLQSCGISEANRLNKAAIQSLASLEFERALKLFGISRTDTFEGLKDAVDALFSVSKGEFMPFTYSFPDRNTLCWEWPEGSCFAYQGMQRMGVIDSYECGVIHRVLCWIGNAGVKCSVSPGMETCLMHARGRCAGEIRLEFP